MSKNTDVSAYMEALEHPLKAEIEALRAIILGADGRIQESVKWNAPSFYIDRHFATFRLHPGGILQVILHTDAKGKGSPEEIKVEDPEGLLKRAAPDRYVAAFNSMEDVRSKGTAFSSILKQWIEQL